MYLLLQLAASVDTGESRLSATIAYRRFQLREILSERPLDWWLKAKVNRFHCRPPHCMPGLVASSSSGM